MTCQISATLGDNMSDSFTCNISNGRSSVNMDENEVSHDKDDMDA